MNATTNAACRTLAIFALGAATLPAQQVTVVQGSGTDLNTAVQGAAPGDILLVRPGVYSEVIVPRGITVLCDQGVALTNGSPGSTALLEFRGIPATEVAVWRGAVLDQSTDDGLRVANCPGAIHLEEIQCPEARIDRADRLTLAGTRIEPAPTQPGAHLVSITDSNVSFINSTIRAYQPAPSDTQVVSITRSEVSLNDTVVRSPVTVFFHDVVVLDKGTLWVQGAGSAVTKFVRTGPGSAIRVIDGELVLDPAARLTAAGSPTIAGTVPRLAKIAFVDAASSVAGASTTLRSAAPAGQLVATLIGLHGPRIPGPIGALWIQQPAITLDVSLVPQGGSVTVPYTLPAAAFGVPVMFQAVGIDVTAGSIELGPPSVVVGL